MRIVGLKEFLALPDETLYCKYRSLANFGDLCIKMNSIDDIDFVYQNMLEIESDGGNDYTDKMFAAEEQGVSLKLDLDCCGRDGMYDREAKFVVFDKVDVEAIIARLQPVMKVFGS